MLFFSAHSRFLARLLFAYAAPCCAMPFLCYSTRCQPVDFRRFAVPFQLRSFPRRVNSVLFLGVTVLYRFDAPRLALLLHLGAALPRNVSTLIYAVAALIGTVPLLFRAPFWALVSHDPIPKVFFKSLFIESILTRVLKKTIKFSSSGRPLAYPSRMHMVGYHHAVLASIARWSTFVYRCVTGYH